MFLRTKTGPIDIVRPRVPINAANSVEFATALEPSLLGGPPMAVLDLSHVEQLDSVGLEEIVDQQERFVQLGGDLKLANANALCVDILRITGISDHIELYANVESAVSSFEKAP